MNGTDVATCRGGPAVCLRDKSVPAYVLYCVHYFIPCPTLPVTVADATTKLDRAVLGVEFVEGPLEFGWLVDACILFNDVDDD